MTGVRRGALPICVFFFQAEDGIRDRLVTGVQTCALPILDICRQHFKPEKFYFICANVAQPGRAADL